MHCTHKQWPFSSKSYKRTHHHKKSNKSSFSPQLSRHRHTTFSIINKTHNQQHYDSPIIWISVVVARQEPIAVARLLGNRRHQQPCGYFIGVATTSTVSQQCCCWPIILIYLGIVLGCLAAGGCSSDNDHIYRYLQRSATQLVGGCRHW